MREQKVRVSCGNEVRSCILSLSAKVRLCTWNIDLTFPLNISATAVHDQEQMLAILSKDIVSALSSLECYSSWLVSMETNRTVSWQLRDKMFPLVGWYKILGEATRIVAHTPVIRQSFPVEIHNFQ